MQNLCKVVSVYALFALYISSYCNQQNEIIPQSSYSLYRVEEIQNPRKNKINLIFYTFDGNVIKIIDDPVSGDISKRLDPSAPNPQPVSFKILLRYPMKGYRGYHIYFYDKNENIIYETPYRTTYTKFFPKISPKELNKIARRAFPKPLDLSIVKNETWSWLNPLTWFKK